MEFKLPTEISAMTNDELINFHGRLHAYYKRLIEQKEKFNLEELVNQHKFIFDEFRARDLRHKDIDFLDEETNRLTKIFLSLPTDDSLDEELIMLSISRKALADGAWSASAFSSQVRDEDRAKRGLPGIYLKPPHGRLIAEGKKRLIVKSVRFSRYTGTPIIVVSGKKAYAEIVLKPPVEINLEEFNELRAQHRISDAERKRWWGNKRKFYAYEFEIQRIYDEPIEVEVLPGVQTFIREVRIKKRISREFYEALTKIEDIVIVPDFISLSGSAVIDGPSSDYDFIWRARFDEDKLILQLREFLMKFTRVFPKESHENFHHVDSPSGPAWHYMPIADLVLRLKKKFEIIELEDDAYAYYKNSEVCDKADFRIKLMEPFTPIKSKAGYHTGEWFQGEEDELWNMWAKGYIEKRSACELCDLANGQIRTKFYAQNEKFIIVDCATCEIPMLVFKPHREWDDDELLRAKRFALESFPELTGFRMERRRVPNHPHFHILREQADERK